MIFIVVLLLATALFLFFRLFFVKREMKHLSKQLEQYNERKTNKRIDVALVDRDIEKLGYEINRLIELHGKETIEKIRYQTEMKQTIANMSHDLRTPLTSILGYIQMMEADIDDPEQKQYLAVAKKRAQRLEALLKDFFELSILESSDHELATENVNIRSATVDVLMNFYDRFQAAKMEPNLQIPEKTIFISAERSAVTRVIENLLSNCLKHATGEVTIRLEEKEESVLLEIANDARGLTEKDAERFFDRFYMADKSRTNENTGLGLSIVKSLMEKMNGSIRSELKNGKLVMICEFKKI